MLYWPENYHPFFYLFFADLATLPDIKTFERRKLILIRKNFFNFSFVEGGGMWGLAGEGQRNLKLVP